MAETIFQATAIFSNGHYVFNDPNNVITLNSTRLQGMTPRNAWLLRYLVPGQSQVQYLLTFEPSSADLADPNTIAGLYIEEDGIGVVIDCISITQFTAVANGTGTIQRRYGAAPAFTNPSANWWCVTRSDDGSAYAHGKLSTDYVGQYIGNVRLKSNTSGTSVYTFQAYGTPKAIGSDSVAQC